MSKVRNCSLLLLLAGFSLLGCAGGPTTRGPWPWDYGGDYGKAKTGNYIGVSGAVAKFGDAPVAARTATAESIKPPSLDEKPSSAPDSVPGAGALPPESGSAKARTIYDFTVRDVKNVPPRYVPQGSADTTHDITAINHGMAPVSVVVQINEDRSENFRIDKDMPLYAVVPPNSEQVLFRTQAEQKGLQTRVNYSFSWGIGVYTAKHHCPEGYRFPFGSKVKADAVLDEGENTSNNDHFAITFTMPVRTAILVARKGTISRIKDKSTIDILHEDSTIATYQHMGEIAKGITEGKTVSAGEPLGVVGAIGKEKEGYLSFVVWRPEATHFEGEASKARTLGFTTRSFPLEFCTDSGQCATLTHSQPVPGPPPAKPKSRERRKS